MEKNENYRKAENYRPFIKKKVEAEAMPDNDIKKALECCGRLKGQDCDTCPLTELQLSECTAKVATESLNLINRKQAEKETMQEYINCLRTEIAGLKSDLTLKTYDYEHLLMKCKELQAISSSRKDRLMQTVVKLQTAKSEAIKEFWEKLKTEARLRNHTNYGKNELATAHNEGVIIARKHTLVCGDNLVKEMTEQSTGYGSSKTEGGTDESDVKISWQ